MSASVKRGRSYEFQLSFQLQWFGSHAGLFIHSYPHLPVRTRSSQAAPLHPGRQVPQLCPEKLPLQRHVLLKNLVGQPSRSSLPSWGYWGPWGRESAVTASHLPLPDEEPQRSVPGPDRGRRSGQHTPFLKASTVAHCLGNWAQACWKNSRGNMYPRERSPWIFILLEAKLWFCSVETEAHR